MKLIESHILHVVSQHLTQHDRFVPANPANFRIGDVVEVQATASMVPVKDDHFRMILHLRSMALLDNGPSLVGSRIKSPASEQTINVNNHFLESEQISPQVHHTSTNIPNAY